MELGRETPDSTTCARLLEDGLAAIGAGFRVVRQSLAPTVFQPSAISRQPSAWPCGPTPSAPPADG